LNAIHFFNRDANVIGRFLANAFLMAEGFQQENGQNAVRIKRRPNRQVYEYLQDRLQASQEEANGHGADESEPIRQFGGEYFCRNPDRMQGR
jgi:hypothetical protein